MKKQTRMSAPLLNLKAGQTLRSVPLLRASGSSVVNPLLTDLWDAHTSNNPG